jgi:MFS family permease
VATDLTPLRAHRDYRLLWAGNLISTAGRQVTVVALPYQVFSLTHSSLAVGGIGAAQVVPLVALSLTGGAIADSTDRRRLLLVTNALLGLCAALLTVGAYLQWGSVAFLYCIAAVISGVSAVDGPTRAALIPTLVPIEHLASALSLNAVGFQVTLIAGPALAGVILAAFGTGPAYLIDLVTFGAAIGAVLGMRARPLPRQHREPMLQAMRRGLRFTWTHGILRASFALDITAMIFGLRRALFPVLATSVYGWGPTGLGILYAAPGVGALLAALTSGWVGRTRRQGWIVIGSVAVWGLSVIVLGFAPSLWMAALAVGVGGAADSYSAVSRTTIVQTVTPDELRGRTSALFSMSANVGNYLGDIEAGATASATNPEFAIVSGGILVLVSLGLFTATNADLRRYRAAYLVETRAADDADVRSAQPDSVP